VSQVESHEEFQNGIEFPTIPVDNMRFCFVFVMMDILKESVAGGLSGVLTRLVTNPLDVFKIRAQLHGERHFLSMRDICRDIYGAHGVQGLFRGAVPGMGLYAVYSAVQFPVYHTSKKFLPDELAMVNSVLAAAVGACAATTVSYPLDIVRTRRVYHKTSSIGSILKEIAGEKRFGMGFYQGLFPALVSVVPRMALSFGIYEELIRWGAPTDWPVLLNLFAGGIAGLAAKGVIYPLDTVGRRMQVKSSAGIVSIVSGILSQEGFAGFYKGFIPTCFKSIVSTACSLAFYDYFIKSMKHIE